MKYFEDLKNESKVHIEPTEHILVKEVISPGINLTSEQQQVIIELQKGNSVVVDSVIGSGKALPNYQGVLTPDGYKPIGTIKAEDLVASNDGKFYPILGVYPQGKQPVYEITFNYGIKSRCSDEHIWTVSRDFGRTYHDETLNEILKRGYKKWNKWSNSFMHKVELPEVEPIEYSEKNLPIDPYLLGCLIGDGGLSDKKGSLTFSSVDDFILDKISNILARDWGMKLVKAKEAADWRISFNGNRPKGKNYHKLSPLKLELSKLSLLTTSYDKHIPEIYLRSSVNQRRDLLAGLMDTDGFISKGGGKDFNTSSPQLAKDMITLLQSLGYMTSWKKEPTNYTAKGDSTRHAGKDTYRISIFGDRPVATLPRKLEREESWKGRALRKRFRIYNIEYIGDEECTCIKVAAPNHLFLTEHCVPTHNTSCIQEICNSFPNSRILYLTYNKLLKLDAKQKIRNKNTTVQNYHGFVYTYLIRRNLRCPPDKQIKTFLEKCTEVPLIYDIICIDEYQDLEEDTSKLLLHIAKECPKAQWVFVGDMAQKIYDKTKIDVYKDCIDRIVPNYIPLQFTKCFRINAEHAKKLSEIWEKPVVGINENCKITYTMRFEDLLRVIDGYENKDILIIGPRYGLTPDIVNLLEKHNPIKYNKSTVWTSIRDRDENTQIKPESLIVTTYDGCKGMERRVCIVLDWHGSHYKTRVEKPFVDKQIITNLFCVAGSRGKDIILFYKDPSSKSRAFFEKKDLETSYSQSLPDFNPSSMFDFRFQADIEKCMKFVNCKKVEQEDTSIIETIDRDENIDLTPCIGMYQEINFFKNFCFEVAVDQYENTPTNIRIKNFIRGITEMTPEQKALALTALETGLFRYISQASDNFITLENAQKLYDRLKSRLSPTSTRIQVKCHSVTKFTAQGRMDYVGTDNIPTELKFVARLSNQHFLQAAMYSIMFGSPYVNLWNTKTNDLYEVSVTDKDKFLDQVYETITLGRKLKRS